MDIGLPEILMILVIVLLLFGSSRLPKLSRTIGESMRELRGGLAGTEPTSEKTEDVEQKEEAPQETQT